MMFSVIIPYYKKRIYIERCIDSVINQTFNDFEIILIDDGSLDDISKLWNEKYRNTVKFITQSNQGVSSARNLGVKNSKGEYIAFLDADDCWSPHYLQIMFNLISTQNIVNIIGSRYVTNINNLEVNAFNHDEINILHLKDYFKNQAIKNTLFSCSSTVVNRCFFNDDKSYFKDSLKIGEDTDMWIRIVLWSKNSGIFYLYNDLVYYSQEDSSQATRKLHQLKDTLVGNINSYYNYLDINKNVEFMKFVSQYVYLFIYPYYFNSEQHDKAVALIKRNHFHYFLLDIAYNLPLFVRKLISNSPKLLRLYRKYLKFILRYCIK